MFLHLSVSDSVHRGEAGVSGRHHPWADTPQADTPWTDTPCQVHAGIYDPTRQPLQRSVSILLECFLFESIIHHI